MQCQILVSFNTFTLLVYFLFIIALLLITRLATTKYVCSELITFKKNGQIYNFTNIKEPHDSFHTQTNTHTKPSMGFNIIMCRIYSVIHAHAYISKHHSTIHEVVMLLNYTIIHYNLYILCATDDCVSI